MKKPHYPFQPIASTNSLARFLSVPLRDLLTVAEDPATCYRANPPTPKKSGGVRRTFDVQPPLDHIQDQILHCMLNKVQYPDYLFGVPDTSYVQNAELHARPQVLIREDARDFYDSIPAAAVQNLWQRFFHFPPAVASLLTSLTTYRGALPQGASTSTAIAALIFWDKEYRLASDLRALGFTYSRYVDDITVSTCQVVDSDTLYAVKLRVYGLLRSLNIMPNRRKAKHSVARRGSSQRVHGLVVNHMPITIPQSYRRQVRQEIFSLTKLDADARSKPDYAQRYESLLGKAHHIRKLHPAEGESLVASLQRFAPLIKSL